jgi:type I restriction enzyme, S subunit
MPAASTIQGRLRLNSYIQAARKKLQALRLSALQEALELPSGIQFRRAGKLFRWASGKRIDLSVVTSGGIPVFGGNGVIGYANQPIENEATIVIGRVGAHCGNVHLTEGPAWITDNAIYAKFCSSEILLPFAALVFRGARLRGRAAGSGQPFVNQKILNEIEIPCIPVKHQAGILARHREAEEALSRAEGQLHTLIRRSERLRSSILSAAFSGKLTSRGVSA